MKVVLGRLQPPEDRCLRGLDRYQHVRRSKANHLGPRVFGLPSRFGDDEFRRA